MSENAVVVVGGANVDHKVRSLAPVTRHTSNPGRSHTSPGGVGRNIAENLVRLGTPTHLIAAVGRDPAGESLLRDTRAAGVRTDHVHFSTHPTGTYTAVLDANGDLLVAIADMTATDELSPADLHHTRELVAGAAMLVLDGNLATATLNYLADLAKAAGVPVVIDPVSVPKAALLGPGIVPERPYFAITPNRDELQALVGLPVRSDKELLSAAAALHDRGVSHVWVRLGPGGSLLSSGDHGHAFLPAPPAEVVDVTGAGDSMLAAFVHAILGGAEPVDAARFGHAAAALTVATAATVRPDLTPRLVEETLNHL